LQQATRLHEVREQQELRLLGPEQFAYQDETQ
jgi:hypothetical protein